MSLQLTVHIVNSSHVLTRLVAQPGEVYRLPEGRRHLRVSHGAAWISTQGRDIVLRSGEQIAAGTPTEPIVVSSLGRKPLVLEVLRESAEHKPERMLWPLGAEYDHLSPRLLAALRNPSNLETDWLWLAAQLEHPQEKRYCLRYALFINPNSTEARRALRELRK